MSDDLTPQIDFDDHTEDLTDYRAEFIKQYGRPAKDAAELRALDLEADVLHWRSRYHAARALYIACLDLLRAEILKNETLRREFRSRHVPKNE